MKERERESSPGSTARAAPFRAAHAPSAPGPAPGGWADHPLGRGLYADPAPSPPNPQQSCRGRRTSPPNPESCRGRRGRRTALGPRSALRGPKADQPRSLASSPICERLGGFRAGAGPPPRGSKAARNDPCPKGRSIDPRGTRSQGVPREAAKPGASAPCKSIQQTAVTAQPWASRLRCINLMPFC